MATIQTFSAKAFAERNKKPARGTGRRSEERQRVVEEYKQALQNLEPGAGGEVSLDEGEVKRTVRLIIKDAADDLGKSLKFFPVRNSQLIKFQVITPEEKAAQPERRGRPKKEKGAS